MSCARRGRQHENVTRIVSCLDALDVCVESVKFASDSSCVGAVEVESMRFTCGSASTGAVAREVGDVKARDGSSTGAVAGDPCHTADAHDGSSSGAVVGNLRGGEYEGDDALAALPDHKLMSTKFDPEPLGERVVPPSRSPTFTEWSDDRLETTSQARSCLLLWLRRLRRRSLLKGYI